MTDVKPGLRPMFLHRRRVLQLFATASIVFAAVACGGDAPEPGLVGIALFQADATVLEAADASVTLQWRVDGTPSSVRLLSQPGGELGVAATGQITLTPPADADTITYTLVAALGGDVRTASLIVQRATPTILRGSFALDNLIDEADADPAAAAMAVADTSGNAAGALRLALAEALEALPSAVAAAGVTEPAGVRTQRQVVTDALARVVAPTSVYAGERVVVVDRDGIIRDVGSVAADGRWRVELPRYGVHALLRARTDGRGDLVCYQALEVETRVAGSRAVSVEPLLVRSSPSSDATLGRFALNELSGRLSVVRGAVPESLTLPESLRGFFQISDSILRCEHPDPARLTVNARFEIESPVETSTSNAGSAVNPPGALDFANLWTTNADDSASDVTIASDAVAGDGSASAELRYRTDEPIATLPILHDTCLLNFDKCTERFDAGDTLLPFLGVGDLSVSPTLLADGDVDILRSARVRTATVRGVAVRSNGTPVANTLILFQDLASGTIGMGRTDSAGAYAVSVALDGSGAFVAIASVRGIGRGTAECSPNGICTFDRVRVYDGRDEWGGSTRIVFR